MGAEPGDLTSVVPRHLEDPPMGGVVDGLYHVAEVVAVGAKVAVAANCQDACDEREHEHGRDDREGPHPAAGAHEARQLDCPV